MNRQLTHLIKSSALLVTLAWLATACGKDDKPAVKPPPDQPPAQAAATATPTAAAPAAPTAPAQAKPLSELESLAAPIALYPDPLLAELLVASTYPLEVVQAARWLESKPDLNGLKDKGWDASIMRLAEVPQVLKMMNDHLDWTTRLGDTFLAKPDELMNVIQGLRRRAKQSGFLKDTPEQKVSTKTEEVREVPVTAPGAAEVKAQPAVYKKEVVYIEPAKPDTLYVPQYQPETAYQAPLAPPPASSAPSSDTGYAAAPATVNNYYPAATTTTSSTSNDLMTFGMGALAGGLLTWGIMEWTHHNDNYYGGYYRGGYYPPVSHYYGGSVCRYGNCWNGGGNWNQGNINRNTNVSGNEINIDRTRTFNQSQLTNLKSERQPWTHDPGHRRGATYPADVRDRLGQADRPGLAGGRPGSPQTLPADGRNNPGQGDRPGLGDRQTGTGDRLGADRRPSSDQIRESLSKGTRLQDPAGKGQPADRAGQNRPATADVRQGVQSGQRPNALEGMREPGAGAKAEQRRGAESRASLQDKKRGAGDRQGVAGRDRPQPTANTLQPRETPPRAQRQAPQGGRDFSQARTQQQRAEAQRPSAFEGAREQGRTQDFSKRGAASRESMANLGQGGGLQNRSGGSGFQGGNLPNRPNGGGGFGGGGGLQNRGGGGGGFGGGGGLQNRGGGGGGFGGGGGLRGRR